MSGNESLSQFLMKFAASHVVGTAFGTATQFVFEGATWMYAKLSESDRQNKAKYWWISWETKENPKNHTSGSYGTWYFQTEEDAWAAYNKWSGSRYLSEPQAPTES